MICDGYHRHLSAPDIGVPILWAQGRWRFAAPGLEGEDRGIGSPHGVPFPRLSSPCVVPAVLIAPAPLPVVPRAAPLLAELAAELEAFQEAERMKFRRVGEERGE